MVKVFINKILNVYITKIRTKQWSTFEPIIGNIVEKMIEGMIIYKLYVCDKKSFDASR